PNQQPTCPMPRDKVVDRYFMEHRAKLLDVAAFLDRLDRSEAPADADDDFRVEALQRAIALLIDEKGERAKRVLELFSDPTETPIDKAPMKGADGAYRPG
ncbi:MAG: hypothetical protein ACPG4Q_15520, partial [Phycisphaeraceae bacterium]